MVKPDEEQVRKSAVERYLEGTTANDVCRECNRSRQWFYKWLKRYQKGGVNWYKEQSRAPRGIANRIPQKTEDQVLNIRSRLENTRYSQIGSMAIQWGMKNWELGRRLLGPSIGYSNDIMSCGRRKYMRPAENRIQT